MHLHNQNWTKYDTKRDHSGGTLMRSLSRSLPWQAALTHIYLAGLNSIPLLTRHSPTWSFIFQHECTCVSSVQLLRVAWLLFSRLKRQRGVSRAAVCPTFGYRWTERVGAVIAWACLSRLNINTSVAQTRLTTYSSWFQWKELVMNNEWELLWTCSIPFSSWCPPLPASPKQSLAIFVLWSITILQMSKVQEGWPFQIHFLSSLVK